MFFYWWLLSGWSIWQSEADAHHISPEVGSQPISRGFNRTRAVCPLPLGNHVSIITKRVQLSTWHVWHRPDDVGNLDRSEGIPGSGYRAWTKDSAPVHQVFNHEQELPHFGCRGWFGNSCCQHLERRHHKVSELVNNCSRSTQSLGSLQKQWLWLFTSSSSYTRLERRWISNPVFINVANGLDPFFDLTCCVYIICK